MEFCDHGGSISIHATAAKYLPRQNTVRELSSHPPRPQHTSKKAPKNMHLDLPCSPSPYAVADHMPSAFGGRPQTGDLALPLLDPPIKAYRARFITLNEMSVVLHHSGFISIPIDAVASLSIRRKG
jgi:hypothetical protein